MQIDRPGVGFAEQVIFDLRRPKLGIHVRLVFAEETTVLGLDSNDSIHSNQITRRIATWLSEKEGPLTSILSPSGKKQTARFEGNAGACVTRLRLSARALKKRAVPALPTRKAQ